MDRIIPQEEIKRRKKRLFIRVTVIVAIVIAAIIAIATMMRSSIDRTKVTIGECSRGTVETSVASTGKVVPAYEQVITSPISTRILEIYCSPGDSVGAGTSLLKLDLLSAEAEINRMRDEQLKLSLSLEQTRLNNLTAIRSLELKIKVKEMDVNRLAAELTNEIRLDSLGSGTGDRVNEARYALSTARIELQQLTSQLENETRARDAEVARQKLDIDIAGRNLGEQLRMADDARIKSPRSATVTYIVSDIGSQVSQGERLATIADLSHFKVAASIAESRADVVTAGGKAIVKSGGNRFTGTIVEVSPLSTEGSVKFTVKLDNDSSAILRTGLSTDVMVLKDVHSDVLRIPMGLYYTSGPGTYYLYVAKTDDEVERRKVTLGEADYDFVEVISGIEEGEKVILSDISKYNRTSYKLK